MPKGNKYTAEAQDESTGGSISQGENISVFLNIRPMNKLELSRRSKHCITIHSSNDNRKNEITVDSHLDGKHEFSFDEVFEESDADDLVYDRVVAPLASKLMAGYNCALVAFGQSKSGKSRMLLGRKTSLGADESGTTSQSEDESYGSRDVPNTAAVEHDGIIAKVSHDLFQKMKESSEELEFTVKISYIEIYLEQIRDLLNPNKRFLKIKDAEDLFDQYKLVHGAMPKIEGLSEVCCISANDIIALVKRGHAYRIVGEERKQTDLSRSHTILSVKIEQKNLITEKTITSTFLIANTAGSEVDGTKQSSRSLLNTPHSSQLEETLANRSHLALDSVVKSLESDEIPPKRSATFMESKLTNVLTEALGGNSYCTFLIAASPASTNVKATLNSMRFGMRLLRVTNHPLINVQASPRECIIELEKSKKIQSELLHLVKVVSVEVRKVQGKTSAISLEPDIWDALNKICSKNKFFEQEESQNIDFSHTSVSVAEELKMEREKNAKLNERLADILDSKGMAQNAVDMLQGECLFLRRESDEVLQAKKKNTIDLIESQNEIQTINERKLEIEHNLRTSRFRESESVLFLRHFRRFYRRLLENVYAQGSGDLNNIVSHMVGAPDLGGLTDIDKLLMESGFLEDFEVGQETENREYHPSSAALLRSSSANKAMGILSPIEPSGSSHVVRQLENARNAVHRSLAGRSTGSSENAPTSKTFSSLSSLTASSDFPVDLNPSDTPDLSYASPVISTHSSTEVKELNQTTDQSVRKLASAYSSVPLSLAAQLTENRVEGLEKEVLAMTHRCMELQTTLNNTEEQLEILASKKKNFKKLQSGKEFIDVRADLAAKAADLEAVIWKMNELHLVNRSYNDRLSNRDQYIMYLEDSLRSFQDKNLRLLTVHIENEKKLRDEAERLNAVIDSLTTQLWQEGAVEVPLESRIIVPFQGLATMSDRHDTSSISGSDTERHKERRDTLDSRRSYEEGQLSVPFTSVEVSPEVDLATLLKGGKTNDYAPRRFTEKRGLTIKSATMYRTSPVVAKTLASSGSFGKISRSFSGASSGGDSLDLATFREQIHQLDILTKSWNERPSVSVTE